MEGLICLLPVALLFAAFFGYIGEWFGRQRNRSMEGFWLGFCLGPFGWLLALLLPAGNQPIEQSVYGRCPTCGGALVGTYPKCPHCASDVYWAGRVPLKTAQEAADEIRLAAERREQEERRALPEKRLAAEREAERLAAADREVERLAAEREVARLLWIERRRAVLSALVSGARWLVRKANEVLRRLGQHRRKTQATKFFVSSRWWLRKVNRVLQGWAVQLERNGNRTVEPPKP